MVTGITTIKVIRTDIVTTVRGGEMADDGIATTVIGANTSTGSMNGASTSGASTGGRTATFGASTIPTVTFTFSTDVSSASRSLVE